jgi:hypothetical protein
MKKVDATRRLAWMWPKLSGAESCWGKVAIPLLSAITCAIFMKKKGGSALSGAQEVKGRRSAHGPVGIDEAARVRLLLA